MKAIGIHISSDIIKRFKFALSFSAALVVSVYVTLKIEEAFQQQQYALVILLFALLVLFITLFGGVLYDLFDRRRPYH